MSWQVSMCMKHKNAMQRLFTLRALVVVVKCDAVVVDDGDDVDVVVMVAEWIIKTYNRRT